VRANLTHPDEKIVFDRYHLMRYVTGALDEVRRKEHRTLSRAGNKVLTGSRYLWLYSAENLPDRWRDRFAALRCVDLKTGRA
jgi:transposase